MVVAGTIRQARWDDLDQIAGIYLACFPERVAAVFGSRPRRALIRDYLGFYCSWDPESNWVYTEGDTVVGFLIAPTRYVPLRAVLSRGQGLRWIGHFLLGRYGLPWTIAATLLRAGFSLHPDPGVRRFWGKPYIHGIAVAPSPAARRVGIGAALIRHMLAQHARRGIVYCWGVVPVWNARAAEFHRRLGAEVEATLENGDQIIAYRIPGAAPEPASRGASPVALGPGP
jgi:ribosomal protein S18 acetylase RimI-like enzyme